MLSSICVSQNDKAGLVEVVEGSFVCSVSEVAQWKTLREGSETDYRIDKWRGRITSTSSSAVRFLMQCKMSLGFLLHSCKARTGQVLGTHSNSLPHLVEHQ